MAPMLKTKKSKIDELNKTNESLQSQIAERDKDLKTLKKQVEDNGAQSLILRLTIVMIGIHMN